MSRFALLSACILLLCFPVPGATGARVQDSAEQVASALQTKYDNIRDFTADFTQQYESGIFRKKLVERGKVQVKKPGRMRWDYTAPDKKVFVSDGSSVYLWVPA